MAFTRLTREIPITAAGGTFTIDVDSPEVEYTITGVATMAGNVTISPTSSGTIPNNTKVTWCSIEKTVRLKCKLTRKVNG